MTFQQARDAGYHTHRYLSGDWEYADEDGHEHLYRDGIELTQGVITRCSYSYENGDWNYRDENANFHLYRNGIELTKGVIAKWCHSYDNGDWRYIDEDGRRHFMLKEQA